MQHQTVVSSNISSVGYDSTLATLEVTFKSGRSYRYTGVPAQVHVQFLAAGSHGKYFHTHIRDRYPTEQVA
jgi:hypothetical protein